MRKTKAALTQEIRDLEARLAQLEVENKELKDRQFYTLALVAQVEQYRDLLESFNEYKPGPLNDNQYRSWWYQVRSWFFGK